MKTRRIRPGLYVVTAGNVEWTVEERRDTFGGGRGWAWFAESNDGGAFDPMPTLRDVKAALAAGHAADRAGAALPGCDCMTEPDPLDPHGPERVLTHALSCPLHPEH